jgi:hypothetical protein
MDSARQLCFQIQPAQEPSVKKDAASLLLLVRRDFLRGAGLIAAGLALPRGVLAGSHSATAAREAAQRSPLIYVSPLKSNGLESRCHGEVWFVPDGADLLVVTNPRNFRATCIGKGLSRARIWVGDFGLWKKSEGAFRQGPSFVAMASLEEEPAVHTRALEAFGKKYADEWDKWGPRFSKGLASGERVLIRYSAAR